MRVVFRVCSLALCAITAAYGSSITGVSTNASGTSYTVTYNNFATVGGTPGANQVGMAGVVMTATFGDGTDTCTWVNATGCVGAGFTVNFPNISTDPDAGGGANAFWTITNTRTNAAGHQMISLFINGIPGLTSFDRCMTGANAFSDATNSGGSCLTNSGGIEGTTGSNVGWSVSSSTQTATAGITASALYANQLKIATQAFQGDAWGSLTLTFAGTAFQGGSNFTFQADTDSISTASAIVPEPATYGMVGLSLLGFGLLSKFARRGPKQSRL